MGCSAFFLAFVLRAFWAFQSSWRPSCVETQGERDGGWGLRVRARVRAFRVCGCLSSIVCMCVISFNAQFMMVCVQLRTGMCAYTIVRAFYLVQCPTHGGFVCRTITFSAVACGGF